MHIALLTPIVVIGILSLLVLAKLLVLAIQQGISLSFLLALFFQGRPVSMLCRVKQEMESWGLKVEMQEVLEAWETGMENGSFTGNDVEEALRERILRTRTGRTE